MRRNKTYVTFDTNAYSVIARPQLWRAVRKPFSLKSDVWASRWQRVKWWYLNYCIRKGRIVAAIPEPALKAEALRQSDRASHLIDIGTSAASGPVDIPETRRYIIEAAFEAGFSVQRFPRIGYGSAYHVSEQHWSEDTRHPIEDRQERQSLFVRHFNNYALEAVRDFGERMSFEHGLAQNVSNPQIIQRATPPGISVDRYLWREGLAAEEKSPIAHASVKEFQKELRALLADWADFDIAATHFGYDFDFICTEDKGGPSSNSIFGQTYAHDVTNVFGISTISISELTRHCWRNYRFPIRTVSVRRHCSAAHRG